MARQMPVRFIVQIVPGQGLRARGIDADLALWARSLLELEQLAEATVLRELGADHAVRLLIGGPA
jgi:hypothetical protein